MILSLVTSCLLIFAFFAHNWQRARLTEVKDLKPNCLLTRYPLLFIPGQRSLFYFLAYWNQIPHWLASHGYEVFLISLPWRNKERRKQALHRLLTQKSAENARFHLFLDLSSLDIVKALLEENDFACLASVTLVGREDSQSQSLSARLAIPIEELELPAVKSRTPLFWFLHMIWTSQKISLNHLGWNNPGGQADFFIERARFLAERDLLQKQSSPRLEA